MAQHVCPVWIGYFLASPIRRLFENPEKILGPYVKEGMKVLDVGSAMGFFSLPLAELVGLTGMVICVDLQEKMLKSLEKRALKKGLRDRLKTRVCGQNNLGLDDLANSIDFALASAVVHEVPDAAAFFADIYAALKPGANFLVAEPKGHVTSKEFEKTVSIAEQAGFIAENIHVQGRSRIVLLNK
ncbi:MAG: class I SAM-dependent methyltransferase [Candidatus Latescibacteria bacterium]|nr:class I SAM-dependent methyltransferase [Candidatus Latescibacterota bacterium]